MFYGGMRYTPTAAENALNSTYDYQDDPVITQPDFEQKPEKAGSDGKLESIYSCDSILEQSDYTDCDVDDDPFDHRVKKYLEAHGTEMKLPMANPMQQYEELKIAQVLSRGKLTEKRAKRKFENLKKSLRPHKIVTSDYQEAKDLLKELNSYINKRKKPMTKEQLALKKMAWLKNITHEEVRWIKETDSTNLHPRCDSEEKKMIFDVRKFMKDLVSSSSEEEKELHDYESSGDESIDFSKLHKLRFLFPGTKKGETLKSKPNSSASGRKTKFDTKSGRHRNPNIKRKKISFQKKSSRRKNAKNGKCSAIKNPEELKIAKKELIIMYKELFLHKLQYHAYRMNKDKNLMKHRLFRIWSNRQADGLEKMELDIARRKARLELRMQRVRIRSQEVRKSPTRKKKKPLIIPEIQKATHKRWARTTECMREREKLLIKNRGSNFLAGLLGNRAKIKTRRVLKKELPEMPSNIGEPPPPPRTNKKILKIISKFMESKRPVMTYGDFLRILEGDTSFILDEGFEESKQSETNKKQQDVGDVKSPESRRCREWDAFIKKDKDINCPFLTKRELKDYLNMVNEKFYPDPDFKLAKELVSIDEKALAFQAPKLLKLNYSLMDLEKDTNKAENAKCAQSRAIYFFQYKSEFTPIDLQVAFEQYVYGNVGLGQESHDHPKGCLLIYSNVKLVIAMIEGPVDHLFYHFAGFKNSQLIKFIEQGRVLYACERVSRILNQWLSIVLSPPPGEITYFNNSKKILHRVAEPRVNSFKTKLHNLYTYLSKITGKISKYRDKDDETMPSNMQAQLTPCPCQHCEPEERPGGCDPSSKLTEPKDNFGDLNTTLHELLPSPALVGYLLKYKKLKTIERFLDEFIMQPEIESEDEKYNVVEDAVLCNFVDSDDEKAKPQLIKEIKRGCKEREVILKCQEDLMDALDQTEVRAPWVKYYDTKLFIPKLAKVQVRKKGDPSSRGMDVDQLVDSDDVSLDRPEEEHDQKEEQYVEWSHENEKFEARRKFLNFLDTGTESWQKKVKKFGLTGNQVKEMLEDTKKYQDLRKLLRLQDKMRMMEEEETAKKDETEVVIDEQGDGDKEKTMVSKESIIQESENEVEALLTELEEEVYEAFGEDMEWPRLKTFERWGEFPERFGEERYPLDFPLMEWGGEVDQIRLQTPRTELLDEQGLSEIEEVFTEYTSLVPEDVETIPEAPPVTATSLTDTSTDP
ncbi:hypothetical protein GE061_015510 [Apolygus lucorum]|uniref:Uncharacterized protein n=1 Tax=Apolygus lucorum TaxID=248454 RepID=A0A6A4J351_APOLU|nr:hypothetical protein GE061_015510 [Apolygus lucorum]